MTASQTNNAQGFRDAAMLRYLGEEFWAIRESVMDRMLEILARHSEGVKLTAEQIAQVTGKAGDEERDAEPPYRESGSTAFVSVGGVLAKHASMVNGVSQPAGSSCERIGADLAKARNNPRIETVVLRVESPGGAIAGLSDLGDVIYAMRGEKRMIAFADDQCCSGGAWLASQCEEVYCNKAAAVGSIGVIMVAADRSQQAKASGVKYHVFKSGAFKGTAGAPVEFSAEDLHEMQSRVDTLHQVFVGEVARGRGMDVQAVSSFADGRVFTGQQAVDLGLCDAVCSWEDLLEMISQGQERPGAAIQTTYRGPRTQAAIGDSQMTVQSDAAAQAAKDKLSTEAAQAEAIKTAQADGARIERERISAINTALPGEAFAAARTEAIEKGLDVTGAKALAFDAASTLLTKRAEELTQAKGETQTAKAETEKLHKLVLASGIQEPLPAGKDQEDIATQAQGADGESVKYEARIAALVKGGRTENAARIAAAGEFPEAHSAWRKAQDAKRRKK